ncbi:ATP-binding cassette domain-containing protein [Paraburkholderia sp. Ac-20347]|uniref:ATP-binding cassette domain-containing protein n=1 Tax=Paraburkholderia sp. Ac-20347 TaxID=2703892 RepID=UPI00197F607B|nr:ATP-binding cassette domain-containing protein [Paraburkholderia sp. Ac-20347]MBN3810795.1 ATP-binding cassette domain-containing protein [Paraburkholderia sp. Ac-20347]
MLSIQNLHIGYRGKGGRPLFEDFSLTVAPGEFVVVLGQNGVGKSTLLKALAGDFTLHGFPDSQSRATLTLNGEDVSRIGPRRLAQLRAVLAQSVPNTYPVPVSDVVQLGRYPHLDGPALPYSPEVLAYDMLALAGVAPLAQRNVTTLSGGEFARVQFARALAQLWTLDSHWMPPRYLLMDEPTAALDLVQQHRLFATARRLTREWNIGALAIAHDCNLAARHADRLVLLADGRAIADGPPRDVMRTDLLERCYGAPMQVFGTFDGSVAGIFPA